LHGVAGVNVVAGEAGACDTVAAVGEVLPDQVPAIRGGVEPDVLRRPLDAALQ
jgi:hypothetical protein